MNSKEKINMAFKEEKLKISFNEQEIELIEKHKCEIC